MKINVLKENIFLKCDWWCEVGQAPVCTQAFAPVE
jgi:hypothetical protein